MKKLTLLFPCKIDWESMPRHETGKYCSECKKVIKDYSTSQQKGFASPVFCGQFNSNQLGFNQSRYETKNFKAISLSLLTLLGITGPNNGLTAQSIPTNEVTQPKFSNLKFPLRMEGTIRDKETKKLIANVNITLMQLNSVIYTTKTDTSGQFFFVLLEEDIRDSVFDLRISYYDITRSYLSDTLLKVPVITDPAIKNVVFSIDFLVKPQTFHTLPTLTVTSQGQPFTTVGTSGVVAYQWESNKFFLPIIHTLALTPTVPVIETPDTLKPKPAQKKHLKQDSVKKASGPGKGTAVGLLMAVIAALIVLFRLKKFKS